MLTTFGEAITGIRRNLMKGNLKPEVLKKLRETSGYTIQEIAKKLKVSEQKIKAVEEGKAQFTLNQVKKLAKIYERPLAAFFSNEIPDIQLLKLIKNPTPELCLVVRKADYLFKKAKEELSGLKELSRLEEEFKKQLVAGNIDKVLMLYKTIKNQVLKVKNGEV